MFFVLSLISPLRIWFLPNEIGSKEKHRQSCPKGALHILRPIYKEPLGLPIIGSKINSFKLRFNF